MNKAVDYDLKTVTFRRVVYALQLVVVGLGYLPIKTAWVVSCIVNDKGGHDEPAKG